MAAVSKSAKETARNVSVCPFPLFCVENTFAIAFPLSTLVSELFGFVALYAPAEPSYW